MKTLTDPKITVTGDSITICAKIVDQPFNGLLVTRVSHHHINPGNHKHPRRVQSSNEAVFIEAPGGKIAIPNSIFAAIAAHAEPKTSFAPHFHKSSVPCSVKCCSETPVSFQWQISDEAFPKSTKNHTKPDAAIWTDIEGATGETLDESSIAIGKWIRCKATNATGTTVTQPAQKK